MTQNKVTINLVFRFSLGGKLALSTICPRSQSPQRNPKMGTPEENVDGVTVTVTVTAVTRVFFPRMFPKWTTYGANTSCRR